MIIIPGISVARGEVPGVAWRYNNTTSVVIPAGYYDVNGRGFFLSADYTYTLTGLTTSAEYQYVYIDYSASTATSIVFINSTTAPTWNTQKQGWYSGDDRCVGAVYSPDTLAEIEPFKALMFGRRIRQEVIQKSIASSMDPNDDWQTPNVAESSVFLPVFATEANIKVVNYAANEVVLGWIANEYSSYFAMGDSVYTPGAEKNILGAASYAGFASWGILGASRNVKIGGRNINANGLTAWVSGFGGII